MRARWVHALAATTILVVPFTRAVESQDLRAELSPGRIALIALETPSLENEKSLNEALTSPDAPVRAAAARVAFTQGRRGLLASMIAALQREADSATAIEEARFVAAFGTPETDRTLSAAAEHLPGAAHAINLFVARARGSTLSTPSPKAPGASERRPRMRLLSGHPPGFIASLVETARCRLNQERTDGTSGRASYRPDGRVRHVSFAGTQMSRECRRVVEALLVTYVVEPDRQVPENEEEVLVVPFEPEFVACQDVTPIGPAWRVGDSKAKAPRQIRHPPPVYPLSAMNDRVAGTVVMEAIVGTAGCIGSATVMKSVDPRLDWEALRTLASWTFAPGTVEGTPVAVVIRVELEFKLRR